MVLGELEALVSGNRYIFAGEIYEASREKREWTQQVNTQLERVAVATILREMEPELGPLTEYAGCRVLKGGSKVQEFDGIILNSSAVLFVEAKHTAQKHHLDIMADKLSFMESFLKSTDIPDFKAIGSNAKVVPFFATRCASSKDLEKFSNAGFNVVRPNGSNFSVLRASQQIRQIHSLARKLFR
jgi:Holliday junction resolvase